MRRLLQKLGIAAYFFALPALWVYLRGGKRTRLLLVCNQEFLVVRGWLGAGKWSLPGGGLRKGENSLQALIREVNEETGIELYEKDIKFLYSDKHPRLGFDYDCFAVELKQKPDVKLQKLEIAEYAWMPINSELLGVGDETLQVLDKWLSTK